MFILVLFYLFKDLQCIDWRSSAQLGEAVLNCLMTKQVQKQGTLPCQQKSVLVFLSCTPILFYKQTLFAMTGSTISHSHQGNACSLWASVFLELWDLVTYFTHCHLENSCLQMYSSCRTLHPFMTGLLCSCGKQFLPSSPPPFFFLWWYSQSQKWSRLTESYWDTKALQKYF